MSGYGLSPEVLQCLEATIRNALGADARAQVWIFGSRATGCYRPYSDIDLLIDSPHLTGQILAQIAEAFENSQLPYKVDLVDVRKIADAYAPSILAQKKLLFALA